jgi:putative ABC transport system substrate-binding protein
MAAQMRRRDLTAMLAGTALVLPVAARAQPIMPVLGVLFGGLTAGVKQNFPSFLAGLREFDYVDGKNVALEYRIAEGRYEQLPAMAADLVGRNVEMIIALALPASLAAKAATSKIPIVFAIAADPIARGLVTSLARPGGNLTGTTFLSGELTGKQLQLLHELKPDATKVGFLVNPAAPDVAAQTDRAQAAAEGLGLTLLIVQARAERDFETVFATLAEEHAGALAVSGDEFFLSQAPRIVGLAAHHAIPAVYSVRQFPVAGGLASYGASLTDALHRAGGYAGRILKGAKPADLPVVQTTKFELVINLKTAKALGLTIPTAVLAGADEVIE